MIVAAAGMPAMNLLVERPYEIETFRQSFRLRYGPGLVLAWGERSSGVFGIGAKNRVYM
jgi:hypothetical protein